MNNELSLLSMLFGLALILLSWNTLLYVTQTMYSKTQLTRLTKKPYIILYAAMISQLLEMTILSSRFLILWNTISKLNLSDYFRCQTYFRQIGPDIFWLNRVLKIYLFNLFIFCYSYELVVLFRFIRFQSSLALGEINVKKTAFNYKERKLSIYVKKFLWTYSLTFLLMGIFLILFRSLWLGTQTTETT